MQLVFSSSGDKLNLKTSEVAEWYVQQLDKDKVNYFHHIDRPIAKTMSKLRTVLENTNDFFTKKFNIDVFEKYIGKQLTQNDLNHIHEDWVKLHHDKPGMIRLLEQLSLEKLNDFRDINEFVHEYEDGQMYEYRNYKEQRWAIDNPFGTKILNWNHWQIQIEGNNLGRSTYQKWLNFDDNAVDTDTADMLTMSGNLFIDIKQPRTLHPPKEYQDYCAKHNIECVNSDYVNFANFEDNIDIVRQAFEKNTDDTFFFKT